jgi:hypothetical protein
LASTCTVSSDRERKKIPASHSYTADIVVLFFCFFPGIFLLNSTRYGNGSWLVSKSHQDGGGGVYSQVGDLLTRLSRLIKHVLVFSLPRLDMRGGTVSVFSLEAGSIRLCIPTAPYPFSNIFSFFFIRSAVILLSFIFFDPTVITERHVRQLCRHTRRIAQRALKFEWAGSGGSAASAALCVYA